MSKTPTSKKRFLEYLTGLALAAGTISPALASTPPPSSTAADKQVQFATNFAEKIAAASPDWWPYWQIYKQTFGELYVQYDPWVEVQPHVATAGPEVETMLPSQAFELIKKG